MEILEGDILRLAEELLAEGKAALANSMMSYVEKKGTFRMAAGLPALPSGFINARARAGSVTAARIRQTGEK